ncbi:calcium-binding protein [Mesorhizobium sp. CN2-181]|uniref:calcium-binding protein n=1 Tax=Mesorhizobium yinganensis TaxID=3157707 RepID=UPI0032B763DA
MTDFTLTNKANNFTGGAGTDTFSGLGGGNDVLDGAGGADTFSIDSNQTGSINGGSGTDTVIATDNQFDEALVFSNVEVLKTTTSNLYSTVAQLNQFATIQPGGADFYSFLQGTGGAIDYSTRVASPALLHVEAALCDSAVQITGTSRADFLLGSNFNDTINGGADNDTLYGLSGNDTLNGGAGADAMDGSTGNDTYYVDNAGDTIAEFIGKGVLDKVATTVSYTLAAGVEVEQMQTTSASGTKAINLSGNEFAQKIYGNDGDNDIFGGNGDDTMIGNGGADDFNGGAGSDTASYAGAAAGVIASLTNAAINSGDAKGDTYLSVENLIGTGFDDALNGQQNANDINGGAGNDTIKGYAGFDTLTGGLGKDNFVFNSALATAAIDDITDFNVADDTIQLDDLFFTQIGTPGVLAAGAFHSGAAAHDADDRMIYYANTGQLFYDADGDGGGAAIQIASLSAGLSLTNADFLII